MSNGRGKTHRKKDEETTRRKNFFHSSSSSSSSSSSFPLVSRALVINTHTHTHTHIDTHIDTHSQVLFLLPPLNFPFIKLATPLRAGGFFPSLSLSLYLSFSKYRFSGICSFVLLFFLVSIPHSCSCVLFLLFFLCHQHPRIICRQFPCQFG